jgi:hypothetical protein
MRSSNGGVDQSANTTEQDWRNPARMWVLVSFGSDSGANAKAEEGSDQSMAPVASLPPEVRVCVGQALKVSGHLPSNV